MSQVEHDLRYVARILHDKPLPAKTQWKLVAGFAALLTLGVGATVLFASTIQPVHHQPVVYHTMPLQHTCAGRFGNDCEKFLPRIPNELKGVPVSPPEVY